MRRAAKTIVFLGDGMADEPLAELGSRTPLQYARTPAMDAIARDGRCGLLHTLPDGFPTSSEVANMSVLGCDLATEYCGRGPLEAAGRGIALGREDTVFRVNLVTQRDGVLTDYSAGHLANDTARTLVAALNAALGRPGVRFHAGVSYRCLLVLSGPQFAGKVHTDKPDDNHGEPVERHLPRPASPAGEETARVLRALIRDAGRVLADHPLNRAMVSAGGAPANGIWPWSGGRAGAMRTFRDRYGVPGAVISAVDVIVGLGRCMGMEVIPVPGATGYIDTNYEGKADAAVAALARNDFVYVHLEAIDEVSHAQSVELKVKAIEDFDRRLIGRVMERVGDSADLAVLPDHPVPIARGKHTRDPVPVAVRVKGCAPDGVTCYDEIACRSGSLGLMKGAEFMRVLYPPPGPRPGG